VTVRLKVISNIAQTITAAALLGTLQLHLLDVVEVTSAPPTATRS
jgi:hypothetical protein